VKAPAKRWVMYFDGSLKLGSSGAGVLFISTRGEQLKYVFQILFEVSNNEVEYEALLHGLRLVVSLRIKRLLVYGDSFLVVQQVNKRVGCQQGHHGRCMLWTNTSSRSSSRGWKSTM
jgi:ribonuclease HI